MMLSTWNFEYALPLQSENDISHYLGHQVSLFMFFPFQSPFSSVSVVKIGSNNAEIFSLLFALSPVWNRYSKIVTRHGLPNVQ